MHKQIRLECYSFPFVAHNVITPEARSMMKEAIAEFSSPLTVSVNSVVVFSEFVY